MKKLLLMCVVLSLLFLLVAVVTASQAVPAPRSVQSRHHPLRHRTAAAAPDRLR